MLSNTLFIIYMIMCFLSLQAITLALIIRKHTTTGSTLILGLEYYISYYRELVLNEFAAGPLMRGIDAMVFYALGFTWVRLIDAIIDSQDPAMVKLRRLTNRIFPCLMALSAIIYITMLDEYYSTSVPWQEITVIAGEGVLGIVVTFFTVAYIARGALEQYDGSAGVHPCDTPFPAVLETVRGDVAAADHNQRADHNVRVQEGLFAFLFRGYAKAVPAAHRGGGPRHRC